MKKLFKKLIACTFAAMTLFSVTACDMSRDPEGEQIDESKIQLFVNNFYGGFGNEWLEGYDVKDSETGDVTHVKGAKELFEDIYKDYESPAFPDKKGVQVIVTPEKDHVMSKTEQVPGNRDEIYFNEYVYYYTLLQENIMLDITDVITNPNKLTLGTPNDTSDDVVVSGESGKTILGKFTQEQKDFYGVVSGSTTKYYGIPHYSGYTGLTYNVDMFNEYGAYFRKDVYKCTTCGYMYRTQLEECPNDSEHGALVLRDDVPYKYEEFCDEDGNLDINTILNVIKRTYSNAVLTAGPDGNMSTTIDNGLPRTYDEFLILCEFLKSKGENPVSWAGEQIGTYVTRLVNALAVDYEGLDQAKISFTLEGTATTLGTVVDGEFIEDENDTVVGDQGAEKAKNGEQLVRRRGNYEALKFLQNLLFGKDKVKATGNGHRWVSEDSFNSSNTHVNQQANFLDQNKFFRSAMLIEGCWWESEATDIFNRNGESKMERKFAFMPLPNANEEEYDKRVAGTKKATLFDHIYSLAFIKKNIDPNKVEIAKDFLRFVYSDQQLIQYTQITNTPKALEYEMNDTQLASLSNYGQSLMRMKQESDVLYPFSNHEVYIDNQSDFEARYTFNTMIDVVQKADPCLYFWEDGTTAEDWFNGMYTFRQNKWSSIIG